MVRFAGGDVAAFATLYDGLAPRLYGACCRLVGRQGDPDDLFQDTFAKLHRARGTFVPGTNVLHWALAIARSVHLDGLRRRRRRPTLETFHAVETFPRTVGDFASPEDDVAVLRAAEQVEATLAAMPEPQRTAFLLTQEEGLSAAEAGAILGASETAVRLRVMRAREALREALAKDGAR